MSVENINEEIIKLQNEIQGIDIQLTTRKNELKEKQFDGSATPEDLMEYNRWKGAACHAKTIKNHQLRQLKEKKKVTMNPYDQSYKQIGYFLSTTQLHGSYCFNEQGWYFIDLDDNYTDYFPTISELIEHMKAEME